jgi:hypothetical protein
VTGRESGRKDMVSCACRKGVGCQNPGLCLLPLLAVRRVLAELGWLLLSVRRREAVIRGSIQSVMYTPRVGVECRCEPAITCRLACQ